MSGSDIEFVHNEKFAKTPVGPASKGEVTQVK
jgi:hypothetical protein